MIQDIKKEILYGLRSYRFLILFVGFLFFAMLDPVMTKFIMPEIMKSQVPGITQEALGQMLGTSQLAVMSAYMNDIFQIGSLIIAFTLCGLIAQEIRENTLVLPICSGKQFAGIVLAKIIVFGTALLLFSLIGALINYLYSGILFSYDLSIISVVRSGLLQGVYMVFLTTLIVMWGVIIKKPIATGFLTLASAFGLYFIGGALQIDSYLPSGLIKEASLFAVIPASTLLQTLSITVGIILVLIAVTLIRLKKMEWNER